MAGSEEIEELKGRIERLENALAGAAPKRAVADLSPDEIQAFMKVREVLAADWGEFCGINDCYRCRICAVCKVCRVCRICRVCDFECVCGPCALGDPVSGPGHFSGFGG